MDKLTEKRDLKSDAIGYATKWLKKNCKNFTLPLRVRRIISSGQYIMMTTISNGDKSKNIFLKVVDNVVHQSSVKEWNLNEGRSISFKEFLKEND